MIERHICWGIYSYSTFAICPGRNVVPIGNISFAEMKVHVMNVVKICGSDIGECMLKKMG
ncbi:hypothetical protein GCM10008018_30870 [Paenibacillus marchantiophytorum]|uniref:Uncharacterized protein n=1 Tax=Paenibacillus marchantiophytorum TaxID=1619310 RepID=A0ABQ1ERC4_9BACL|nr:hypothetical protein GCM10008018_30870 [Paenibacillus marchantiophytorum]